MERVPVYIHNSVSCSAGKNKHAWAITKVLKFPDETKEQSVKLEIFFPYLLTIFLHCLILYKNGSIFVFVISSFKSFYSEVNAAYKHKCVGVNADLQKILETKKMFLMYPQSGSHFLLFTQEHRNEPLFHEFNPERYARQNYMTNVKFDDVIKTSSKQEQHNGNLFAVRNQVVSFRRVKSDKMRQKAMPPKKDTLVKLAFPLSPEIPYENQYPTQVSEEQNVPELTENPFNRNFQAYTAFENRSMFTRNPDENVSTPSVTEHSRTRRPPHYPDYVLHSARFVSFTNWTTASQNPVHLSQAGFFFTGTADLVRCFQCGIGMKDFFSDVDPTIEHVRYSPDCPFLRESLGEEGLLEIRRNFNSDPNYNRQWNAGGYSAHQRRYRHPEYTEFETRLTTFTHWPSSMTQTPMQLADAGLFYTGYEDQVRCFACDGGLRRWDAGDDPWTEHCRWFPNCPYAIEVKGAEYIALIQATLDAQADGADAEENLLSAIEQLTLSDPLTQAIMEEYQTNCLVMGYDESDFSTTVRELKNRGVAKPSLDEILDLIDIVKDNRQQQMKPSANETPMDKNRRLKSYIYCMKCQKNDINALFLPCGHHKLCMSCAQTLESCPLCGRQIRETIKTYMA